MFVVSTNVPLMLEPLPTVPPVKPVPDGTVQLYVVPGGTIPLVPLAGVTAKVTPLHSVAVIAVIAGFGFTVTTMFVGVPGQPFVNGVTI